MTRRVLALLLFAMFLASPAIAQEHGGSLKGPLPAFGDIDPKFDPRVVEITKTLGCNCGTCPHEPVDKCTCSYAARLRAEAAAGVFRGEDKDTIIAGMVAKYGETILPRPLFEGLNLVAYLGPFVVIGGVAVWLGFLMAGWKKRAAAKMPAAIPGKAADSSAPAEDPYLAAVDAELEKGDT